MLRRKAIYNRDNKRLAGAYYTSSKVPESLPMPITDPAAFDTVQRKLRSSLLLIPLTSTMCLRTSLISPTHC